MFKKHPLLIVFFSGLILLLSGIGTSYYWLTKIYLPDQINSNVHAKQLEMWIQKDTFTVPENKLITQSQLDRFLLVNESLRFFLQELKSEYNESQWQVVFELIKMQPEWQAKKYMALKKFNLSPLEYEFIADEISKYWIIRLKEKSVNHLNDMGWEIFQNKTDTVIHEINYDLFISNEEKLNNIFTLFLDEDLKNMFLESNEDTSSHY